MDTNEVKKLTYIRTLLGAYRDVDREKVVWEGTDVISLAMARQVAMSGVLPNPYQIEGFSPNGMGPGGIVGRALVLDRFLALLPHYCLESIGDIHDLRYALGGSKSSKTRADIEFRDLIHVAGRGLGWYKRFHFWRISWVYFAFVKGLGDRYFRWTKGGS
jgi:hypothetical protein